MSDSIKKTTFGGRKPGSKNKLTIAVKEALEKAFDELGGVPALVEWGRSNPTEFYKIWVRLLPKKIEAEIEQSESRVVVYLPDDGREQSQTTETPDSIETIS